MRLSNLLLLLLTLLLLLLRHLFCVKFSDIEGEEEVVWFYGWLAGWLAASLGLVLPGLLDSFSRPLSCNFRLGQVCVQARKSLYRHAHAQLHLYTNMRAHTHTVAHAHTHTHAHARARAPHSAPSAVMT